jgi:hypothetical protein
MYVVFYSTILYPQLHCQSIGETEQYKYSTTTSKYADYDQTKQTTRPRTNYNELVRVS